MSKLDDLFDGQVGEFWSLDDDFERGAMMRGFIQRNNDGLIVFPYYQPVGIRLWWRDTYAWAR